MSAIYFLPKVGAIAESAVEMELPMELPISSRNWNFEMLPPSPEELKTLSPDTQFSKAICLSPRPGEFNFQGYRIPDRVDLSVVLSGADINNSIHRPERCMPAQGHNIVSSASVELMLTNGRRLPVKRLVSVQARNAAMPGEREKYVKFNCLTYYFFVGHSQVSNDHLERTLIDMKDRLVKGMDQRWAYVSASMWYGEVPWIENEVTEAEADEKLQEFIMEFAEKQIDWERIDR